MIKIEQIGLASLEELREISIKTYFDTFDGSTSDENMTAYLNDELNLDVLKAEMENPEMLFYFAYVDGKLAGYLKLNVGLAQSEAMPENWMELQRIYIDKDFKGNGLGTALVDHTLHEAKARGISEIWLGVWERNFLAQKFYKKLEFERFSEYSFWMGEDEQTDWLLKRTVE